MKARFLVALMGGGVVFAPLALSQTAQKGNEKPAMSEDMRQAIAFQRQKDVADGRQARKEAIHPSVTYSDTNRSADRSMDDSQGRPVKDPGPATVRKDQ
jgi:hypothetical protein